MASYIVPLLSLLYVALRHPFVINRMCHYAALSAAIYPSLFVVLGLKAVVFFALQSLIAIFILEVFNYVVHYGLLRRVLPDGSIEPLSSSHSWNAPQRFTNWALMNGGYHSEHHRRPSQGYGSLLHDSTAPELPMGYAGTMILALVPPLWRAVMHPRLDRVLERRHTSMPTVSSQRIGTIAPFRALMDDP